MGGSQANSCCGDHDADNRSYRYSNGHFLCDGFLSDVTLAELDVVSLTEALRGFLLDLLRCAQGDGSSWNLSGFFRNLAKRF